jgi:hypothetical protein
MTEKTERRGRPAEQPFEKPEKWTREFYEVPSKPELGTKTTFYYDNSKKLETTTSGVIITGDLTLTDNEIFDANSLKGSYTASTTSTTQTSILSISAVTYRSVEILIQITEGSKYHMEKILAIHDGTTVYTTTYGTITTNGVLSIFDLDIVSNNLRLLATPSSVNSTTFKFSVTAIKV